MAATRTKVLSERRSPFFARPVRAWWCLTIVVVVAATALGWSGAGRLDRAWYDLLIRTRGQAANPDIALIAIDDASLARIGRWPWPHGYHAALLDRLNGAATRAIALDFALDDPSPRNDDIAPLDGHLLDTLGTGRDLVRLGDEGLAAALKQMGRVALSSGPLAPLEGRADRMPLPVLASAASATGFGGFDASRDSITRSAALADPDPRLARHVMVALLDAGSVHATLPARRATLIDRDGSRQIVGIPFTHSDEGYKTYSYADVLRGTVPADTFRNKLVIVGLSAARLGAMVEVPGGNSMSLVELDAQLLGGLIERRSIVSLTPMVNAAVSGLCVLLGCLVLLFMPRIWGGALLSLMLATLVASIVAFQSFGAWMAPGTPLLMLGALYPLWRWMRLEAAAMEISSALYMIDDELPILPELSIPHSRSSDDQVGVRLALPRRIIARVRVLRHFAYHVIDRLPHAALLTNVEGHVVFANRAARNYFTTLNQTQLDGAQLPYMLGQLQLAANSRESTWWDVIDADLGGVSLYASDVRGRDILVQSMPCHGVDGELDGWIATLLDVSAIRVSERRREEALHFMNETLCEPQKAILALIKAQRLQPPADAAATAALLNEIERHARNTSALAEKFSRLALIEASQASLATCDMRRLLDEAITELREPIESRDLTIAVEAPETPVLADVDPDLMWQAFVVLLGNAVRFSKPFGVVTVALSEAGPTGDVTLRFCDNGPGIAPIEQARMLRALRQIAMPGTQAPPAGREMGLGLALVRVIAEKHGARLEFTSNPGQGSEFRLILPRLPTFAAAAVTARALPADDEFDDLEPASGLPVS